MFLDTINILHKSYIMQFLTILANIELNLGMRNNLK